MVLKAVIKLIISLIGLLWVGYRFLRARFVKGKIIEVKPFRRNSKLNSIGTFRAKLLILEKEGNGSWKEDDKIWFICPLENEKKIGNFSFDYIKIRPKYVDDHFNKKKSIIAYIYIGHSKSNKKPKFIDWGFVKIVP